MSRQCHGSFTQGARDASGRAARGRKRDTRARARDANTSVARGHQRGTRARARDAGVSAARGRKWAPSTTGAHGVSKRKRGTRTQAQHPNASAAREHKRSTRAQAQHPSTSAARGRRRGSRAPRAQRHTGTANRTMTRLSASGMTFSADSTRATRNRPQTTREHQRTLSTGRHSAPRQDLFRNNCPWRHVRATRTEVPWCAASVVRGLLNGRRESARPQRELKRRTAGDFAATRVPPDMKDTKGTLRTYHRITSENSC
ncbi:hypothetical protein HDC34_002571 [Pseudoclavibacter sp. JAI123]|nr:hypothetical protein [Pseudoclavibacter sp. JAI123]